MNKLLLLALGIALILQSCCREQNTTYVKKAPVYMTRAELNSSVKTVPAQDLKTPGKIYRYNNLLFVNEYYKGVHIIDNTNPSAPRKIGFINILGNTDIAVSGHYLYADNATDLIVMDITNPQNPVITKREMNVFPNNMQNTQTATRYTLPIDPNAGICVGWKDTIITESSDCN
jgi:hypothetical protein